MARGIGRKLKSRQLKKALRLLGYRNILAYRRSDTWRLIRADVLARHPKCEACGEPSVHVRASRLTVRVLLGDDRNPLFAVCEKHARMARRKSARKKKPRKQSEAQQTANLSDLQRMKIEDPTAFAKFVAKQRKADRERIDRIRPRIPYQRKRDAR